MPKFSVSDQHAGLLVDFFRAQEKELAEKLNGVRTALAELLGNAATVVAPKSTSTTGKKRGRKPGSKNNTAATGASLTATPKKTGKRGRPKGSLNKTKADTPAVAAGAAPKRGRGRPAKNAA